MKKLNFTISSWISRLCAVCLALLGFSCSSEDEPGNNNILCMYGTPIGDFEVKGSVKTSDGNPVSKAVVGITYPDAPSSYGMLSDTTDNQGRYTIKGSYSHHEWKLVCLPQSNTLDSDSTIIKLNFVRDDKVKDNIWYIGSASATVDFVLKKRDSDAESK